VDGIKARGNGLWAIGEWLWAKLMDLRGLGIVDGEW